jgi:starvation-inducible DNA-binding protein
MSTSVAPKLFHTGIDLPANVRTTVITLLNATLADLNDLKSQTKYAHWNVKGSNFYSLHLLFDQLASGFDTHIDDVAERISALGGVAHGTVRQAATNSSIDEFPEDIGSDLEFARVLAQRFASVAATVRSNIDRAAELGDQGTSDLYTGISRELDKDTWFLEAHSRK